MSPGGGGDGGGGENWEKECSIIIDTCFNWGGGLCSSSWMSRCVGYLKSFYPKIKLYKRTNYLWNLFLGGQQGRVSVKSTVIPIWVLDTFKPVRARLIEGETELLLCLDIIRKLAITVEFGSDHFRVGQGELEMMTYNGKHHWLFPLAPTSCAYAKLDGYFWKIQKIENCSPASAWGISRIIWKFGK